MRQDFQAAIQLVEANAYSDIIEEGSSSFNSSSAAAVKLRLGQSVPSLDPDSEQNMTKSVASQTEVAEPDASCPCGHVCACSGHRGHQLSVEVHQGLNLQEGPERVLVEGPPPIDDDDGDSGNGSVAEINMSTDPQVQVGKTDGARVMSKMRRLFGGTLFLHCNQAPGTSGEECLSASAKHNRRYSLSDINYFEYSADTVAKLLAATAVDEVHCPEDGKA